jgi:hypothetical protein
MHTGDRQPDQERAPLSVGPVHTQGVDLCWDEIETRPETQREQLRQLEEVITVAASAFMAAMMQQNH